jgi:hypothetical protein
VVSLTVVLGGAWLTMQSAKQLKLQQAIIENAKSAYGCENKPRQASVMRFGPLAYRHAS